MSEIVYNMKNQLILNKVHELPTLSPLVYELNQLINDPMSSVNEVENLITNDQVISSNILRLANSAFYSVSGGVGSLKRAIAILGFNQVNEIVLSMNVIKMFKRDDAFFNVSKFWQHSLGVAYCCMSLEEYLNNGKHSGDLFSCGLLHDLGKIAFFTVNSKDFVELYLRAEQNKTSILIEEEREGYNCAEIGSELEKKWKLPLLIQKTTFYSGNNYNKVKTDYSLDQSVLQAIDIVNLSNTLINKMKFGNDGSFDNPEIDPLIIKRLKLSDQDLQKINMLVLESLQKAEKFLHVIKA